MSINKQWTINIVMIVLSWISLLFMGSKSMKRFLPASIFIVVFEALNVQIGKKRKWWIFYKKPNSYFSGEFPFNIGPFFAGTIWILKLTYGNFKRFLMLNAIVDGFFAFVIPKWLEKLKVGKLVRLNHFQFFLYMFYKAYILYGFQKMIENSRKELILINKGKSFLNQE
ncbi:hypothetical protein [Litchfieldia salsa]|uniref:Uncharacterized protein n=1 Tax=Litchfieldia salsa TaxID=930152 RepID=A0A1H0SVR1_9BACI|nr:hypothetical protein [Litchfieldia salsa]SDP45745.1 hypothetical protein SAMN05216565_103141 [Litchfieldia salsa]